MPQNHMSDCAQARDIGGPVVRVKNLCKKFGNFTAVDRISFSIKKGEILGFLGPNGAGKTTTLKMIIGLLRITSGDVFINGLDVKKDLRRIKTFIGYMSQKFSLYPLLNAHENMTFFGGVSGLSRHQIRAHRERISQEIPDKMLRQKVMDIPPGIKQKVALATCLMSDPEILLLDEPTSGVDPENRRDFWMQIYGLKKAGKTVLVTTHNLDEAEFSDRIIIIHKGIIVQEGEPFALLEKEGTDSMETLFKKAIESHEAN